MVARYVVFMSSMTISEKKQIFPKLRKMYQLNQYNSPLFVIKDS